MPDVNVRRIKIMISSTRADLAQYREEASRIIKRVAAEKEKQLQLVEVSMEKETQSGDREFPVAVSRLWVEEADWVVVIVGWNYGTISDEAGANGLSVTEWEYRYAFDQHKKLFVFMAGDPGTLNQYRVSVEEWEDLKDWIPKQPREQMEKLDKFKEDIAKRHAEMFVNLQMFRDRLEKTLKDAVDDLPPEFQPGTQLAELIVAVTPQLRECIRKVTLIANCKRIHDCMHELLQHVLRPLREEVLSAWEQEGTLSASRERAILSGVNRASRQLGAISALRKSIGHEHWELCESVDKVLQAPDLWNVDLDSSDSRPSRESFTEVVETFWEDVEDAFSGADRSMTLEETELRERYLFMRDCLERTRQHTNLSPCDHQRLDEELNKFDTNRSRVKNSLIAHHRWQEAHDKLRELDSFRETNVFEKKLCRYRATSLSKLLDLVNREIDPSYVHQAVTTEPEQEAVALIDQSAPPPSLPGSQGGPLVEDLQRLKETLDELRLGGDFVTFDKLYRPFGDIFYGVDKRTLTEISRAGSRAKNLEYWLEELSTGPRKTD